MTAPLTRIILVDDHPLVRAGLKAELQADPTLEVCDEAEDSRQAKERVHKHQPDVVVLDLVLGDEDGLTLIRELRQLAPTVNIVVLSMLDPAVYEPRALAAGANAFVPKTAGISATLAILKRSPTHRVSASLARGRPPATDQTEQLSDRELQVFRLVGLGRTTKEISVALGISPKTVDAHKEHIKLRLSLGNAAQLTAEAARWVSRTTH